MDKKASRLTFSMLTGYRELSLETRAEVPLSGLASAEPPLLAC